MATIKHNASGSILHNAAGNVVNECGGTECESCIGVQPSSRTAIITGVLDGGCFCSALNDQFILTDDPGIGGGPCQLVYLEENFCGSDALTMTLGFFDGEIVFTLSIGALTGSVVFKRTAPAAPYDCDAESIGEYTLFQDTSSQCDFSGMTVEIAA